MKKIYIYAPLDYVAGYLRYGHKEGIVNLTNEDWTVAKVFDRI